jgi:cytochrome o ubiquinol oxidase subunit 2
MLRTGRKPHVMAIGGCFLLSACGMDVLHPEGPVGVREASLIAITSGLMLIVVIPVIFMTFLFAWRYRESNQRANYAPGWAGSLKVELCFWSVPIIIVICLAVIAWRSTLALDPYKPMPGGGKILNVDVVALDWKWLFIYPDQHIATINQLVIPIDTQVAFKITADGPMNVFFIPQLGTQIYAMAGMQTQVHLMAKNPGSYRGLSANFSGAGFPDMRFTTLAASAQDFSKWVKRTQNVPAVFDATAFRKLEVQSTNNQIAYYGRIDPALFGNIVSADQHQTPTTPRKGPE